MRWLALAGGLILLVVTGWDLFGTIVVPRSLRSRWRLTSLFGRSVWRIWRWISLRFSTLERREQAMAVFAPGFVMMLLVLWAGLFLIGYTLVLFSAPFFHGIRTSGTVSFTTTLYLSGTSLFTLGFGDVVTTGATRAVLIIEAATGLGLVALVISYLPTLYASFNRREVGMLILSARAGAPPSGPDLLLSTCRDGLTGLTSVFEEWERWAADVLETHLSYPVLAFFRASHDRESWITSIGAVLDAATLTIVALEDAPLGPAKRAFATGRHAVLDIARALRVQPRDTRIERQEFDRVLKDLASAGLRLRPADQAWEGFVAQRGEYAPQLNALAVWVAAPPAQWIGDRSTWNPKASVH
jgi:hypothetical protein